MRPMSLKLLSNRRKGFTLVELMVSSAVAFTGVLAAAAVFTAQSEFQKKTNRLMSANHGANAALTVMVRDAENMGYRWPLADVAVNPANAVIQSLQNGDGTTLSAIAASNETATGVIQGTDVFESWMGRQPWSTTVSRTGAGNRVTVLLDAEDVLRPTAQETAAGDTSGFPLLLFVNPDNPARHCLGQPVSRTTTAAGLPELEVEGRAPRSLDTISFSGDCPAPQMNVYALERRRRYFIYQSAGSDGIERGLFVQSSNKAGIYTAPAMLAEGATDLQVAWLAATPDAGAATDLPPRCANAALCKLNAETAEDTTDYATRLPQVVGVELQVESQGTEPIARRPLAGADGGQPRAIETPLSLSKHETQVFSTVVHFNNFTQVRP